MTDYIRDRKYKYSFSGKKNAHRKGSPLDGYPQLLIKIHMPPGLKEENVNVVPSLEYNLNPA